MARTQKVKAKPQSVHSRAARRAASPSLDLDKSLTSLPRVETSVVQRASVLTDRANASVSKKQKAKPKSRAQRLRQQKGMERAEAVIDRLEKKVSKSVNREKTVKARRADWEDWNRKASKFAALQQVETGHDDGDVDDGDAMVDDAALVQSKTPASKPQAQNVNPAVDDHVDIDVDDDIT